MKVVGAGKIPAISKRFVEFKKKYIMRLSPMLKKTPKN